MFDNIKKMYELKKMQDSFKKELVTVEQNGVSVTMNGSFEVQDVVLAEGVDVKTQQQAIKLAFNEAREIIQRKLAEKMMSSGNMPNIF